ncbi:hypothetical protein [Aneurinibacillus tyrosinisolvens]|uniref:hypothetical protein n=1 Tax=Aneurinibacillus tyrosinisolvens TaxID=1443435 RepID=UPI00063FBB18|nr:hypothetical protein [Aneurinibacillus tyrosinisolvens]
MKNSDSNHSILNGCKENISRYVKIKTRDNQIYEGYITNVDHENVHLAIPKIKNLVAKLYPYSFPPKCFKQVVLPLLSVVSVLSINYFI